MHPCPHSRDYPFEHRQAGQHHLGREQPGNRAIEQRRRTIGAGPAHRVRNRFSRNATPKSVNLAIAVAIADARTMPPATHACDIIFISPAVPVMPSWSPANRVTVAGVYDRSSISVPSSRNEPSWTATPSRL